MPTSLDADVWPSIRKVILFYFVLGGQTLLIHLFAHVLVKNSVVSRNVELKPAAIRIYICRYQTQFGTSSDDNSNVDSVTKNDTPRSV